MIKRILLAFGLLLMFALFLFPSSHASAAAAPQTIRPFANFAASCSNFSVDQFGVFRAVCRRKNGDPNPTSFGLDGVIGNNDGMLVDGNHFTETCVNIGLSGFNLTADCRTKDGIFVGASFNLNLHLGNSNGVLVWQG